METHIRNPYSEPGFDRYRVSPGVTLGSEGIDKGSTSVVLWVRREWCRISVDGRWPHDGFGWPVTGRNKTVTNL
jgi:hypothetical protein